MIDRLVERLRPHADFLKREDVRGSLGMIGVMGATWTLLFGGLKVSEEVDKRFFLEAREAGQRASAEATRTTILATATVLRTDYETTGGFNRRAIGLNSYLLTLRDSARLSESREDLLANYLDNLTRETGCAYTAAYLPRVNGDPRSHDAYLVAPTICDNSQVR